MKVLIVDDHAVVRRGMISLLREHFKEVEVTEAEDSRSGFAASVLRPGRDGRRW